MTAKDSTPFKSMETEAKFLLSPKDYEKLKNLAAKNHQQVHRLQKNIYFGFSKKYAETYSFKELGLSLRLRIFSPQKAAITLKLKTPHRRSKLFNRIEWEGWIDAEKVDVSKLENGSQSLLELNQEDCIKTSNSSHHPLTELKKILFKNLSFTDKKIPNDLISPIAFNTTKRIQFTLPEINIMGELDRTEFPKGFVGYELEVELPSEEIENESLFLRRIETFLVNEGIEPQISPWSKSTMTFILKENNTELIKALKKAGCIH